MLSDQYDTTWTIYIRGRVVGFEQTIYRSLFALYHKSLYCKIWIMIFQYIWSKKISYFSSDAPQFCIIHMPIRTNINQPNNIRKISHQICVNTNLLPFDLKKYWAFNQRDILMLRWMQWMYRIIKWNKWKYWMCTVIIHIHNSELISSERDLIWWNIWFRYEPDTWIKLIHIFLVDTFMICNQMSVLIGLAITELRHCIEDMFTWISPFWIFVCRKKEQPP